MKTPIEASATQDQAAKPQDIALRGWASRLTSFVVAFLIIEAITGLWIYLTPFSITSQLQVLLHTVAGVVLVIPYLWYQVSHFLSWYRQNISVVMMLGYALMTMVLACVASGIVVTWQAAAGTRVSPLWDIIHLVTGIVVAALVGLHLLFAVRRRRAALKQVTAFADAFRRFTRTSLAWVGAGAAVVAVGAILWSGSPVEFPPPEGYSLPDYVQEFDEYRGNPFAPTYARTASGMLINPDVLAHSESCGSSGCHSEILAEWQPSAHRFSAMNPPFQQVQKNFASDRTPAETRYCAGCHDPISLFAGAKDIQNLDLSAPGMQEGSSCVVCHSISSVDQRGNADYVLTPPKKYLWEATDGARKFTSDFLIRAYPRQHLADYDRNLLRTPEFCGACHKQFIPEALNRFGLSPGQNQYDEWRKSHWHTDDIDTDLSCRDCHMRLVQESTDPGRGEAGDVRRAADDGAHRHHGYIATNLLMPMVLKLPQWEKQVQLTRDWIAGKTVIPEIEHLWPAGPVATVQLLAPDQAVPGEEVALTVLVKNRKAGHNLTTGPLDFMRVWIHMQVTDAAGKTIAEWGNIDPETRWICDLPGQPHQLGNPRDEGTLVLEGQPLDQDGKPLVKHELWQKAGGKGQRVIFPRYTDKQVYRFTVPANATGPLTAKADLDFRRYRQEFLDLVVPTMEQESGVYQPMVNKDSAEKKITLATGG